MIERIGIIGGGQLGRMLTHAATPFGFRVTVVDRTPDCPAAQVGASQIVGSLDDEEALQALAAEVDVITWEIEHIAVPPLQALLESGHKVEPLPSTLAVIQDKLLQKQFLVSHGVPTAPLLDDPHEGDRGPFIVKARRGGYDGRGNLPLDRWDDVAVSQFFDDAATYVERAVPFDREIAVIVARDGFGGTACYPVIETIHVDNICHMAFTPASTSERINQQAIEVAHHVVDLMGGAGVFTIEMFVVGDEVMVNEIAPRVHNSGHLTIEACATSQFEQHVRAISGLPLGSPDLRAPAAAMINILGRDEGKLDRNGLGGALSVARDTHVHFYGKDPSPQRKIGHITVLGDNAGDVRKKAELARAQLSV